MELAIGNNWGLAIPISVRTEMQKAFCATAAVIALTIISFGQESTHKGPQPDKREVPRTVENAVPQTLGGALWRIDHLYKATLRIKNHVQTFPITVTPVLYFADGTKYPLTPIKLAPSGVATVDINHELVATPEDIRPHLSDYGSAGIEFSWPWETSVSVTVENLDALRSLIFTSSTAPTGPASKMDDRHIRIEGLWWTPNSNATAFVTLTNTSESPVAANIAVFGADHRQPATTHVTISPHNTAWYSIAQLWPGFTRNSVGGISVFYEGTRAALIATGGVEDDKTGFSTGMTFTYHFAESTQAKPRFYASAGLMVGTPDPAMLFPKGLRFTPYAVVRNTSAHPLSVSARLNYENPDAKSLNLPPMQLAPFQVLRVPIEELVASGELRNFNGIINLMFTATSHRGDLLISTGSMDQSANFVFQVQAQAISGSARDICFWKASNDGTDTMISLWNYGTKASDLIVTLLHDKGTYKLPVHLEPDHSAMVEVLPLIQNGTPDVDGNVIPITANFGSASVASALGDTREITLASNTATYNVKTATCGDVCDMCTGYDSAFVVENPSFSVDVSGTHQLDLYGHTRTGYNDRYTNSGSWSSSNGSVATVSYGLVSGSNVGTSNIDSFIMLQPSSHMCWDYGYDSCDDVPFDPGSSGTVVLCPTSVALVSSATESLSALFPGTKTGVGIMAKMQASPTTTNWNGAQLTEQVGLVSTACPTGWAGGVTHLCPGSATFTVGDYGLTAQGLDGSRYPAQTNIFFDEHTATDSQSDLDAFNITSCQFVCRQQYTCGGSVRGAFDITYSFTKGTIQGQPVTNVSVTKQQH